MDRKTLEMMLAQGQDNLLLRYTLGSLCLKEGDPAAAVVHLEAALEKDRDHSASWKAYGKALTALARFEDARAAYEQLADEIVEVLNPEPTVTPKLVPTIAKARTSAA